MYILEGEGNWIIMFVVQYMFFLILGIALVLFIISRRLHKKKYQQNIDGVIYMSARIVEKYTKLKDGKKNYYVNFETKSSFKKFNITKKQFETLKSNQKGLVGFAKKEFKSFKRG